MPMTSDVLMQGPPKQPVNEQAMTETTATRRGARCKNRGSRIEFRPAATDRMGL